MNLDEYRTLIVVATLVLTLAAASPTLGLILRLPTGETFSELWILGPDRMADDYPFNVSSGKTYLVYVGVENHMSRSSYYTVYVKFRNETDPLPNQTSETPSPLEPLFEYGFVIRDGESWEMPLNFSFSNVQSFENATLVKTLTLNDVSFDVEKPASWDSSSSGYFYQIFVELWIYNPAVQQMQYHNRFVSLWLNVTQT